MMYTSIAGAGAGTSAGASGAGVVAGVPLAVATSGRANKRKQATNFVSNYENSFGQELAQIELMARTNPQAANQALKQAWDKFLQSSAQFASLPNSSGGTWMEPNRGNAANQALSNPALINTVNTLWGQTGGQGKLTDLSQDFMSGYTAKSEPGLGGNYPRVGGWSLSDIISTVGGVPRVSTSARTPGINPNGSTSSTANKWPGTNTPVPIDPNKAKSGGLSWESIMPWILAAGGLATSIYGGITGSNAAKEAAEIEARSAAEARAQIQGMYDQSRKDQMPWLETGQASLASLSNLMGLPSSAANPYTPSAPYQPIPNGEIRAAQTLGSGVRGGR